MTMVLRLQVPDSRLCTDGLQGMEGGVVMVLSQENEEGRAAKGSLFFFLSLNYPWELNPVLPENLVRRKPTG